METRYAKRKKHLRHRPDNAPAEDDRDGEDRISDLPREIVDRIFSFMPLEHVAKTCVLSKHWKHLWYSYPCLDFSNAFQSILRREREISGPDSAYQKLCDRIDQVLRSFDKRSDVSILKFYGQMESSAVVRSMQLAVEHNVQELDLVFLTPDRFDLPICITDSTSLRDLRLKSWGACYRLPPLDSTTNSFRSLRSLSLSAADFISQSSVLNIFTDPLFPRLEKLRLEYCSGLEHLRIRMSGLKFLYLEDFRILELDISAQKLERLTVNDCLVNNAACSRVAIDAPLLESFSWKGYVNREFVIGRCDSLKEATLQFRFGLVGLISDSLLRGFSSFLDGISRCPKLNLDVSVFEVLSRSNHLARVRPHFFDRLTSLEVKLSDENCAKWNEDFSEIVGYKEDDIDWESRARSFNMFLRRLKVVRISGFKACSNDVGLVKLLLSHAKVLEELSLEYDVESASGEEDETEIMELPRASPNVRIVFPADSLFVF